MGKLEVGPGLPWILVYNHLDVQPADESEWNTKPFEPVVNNKEIIARGATDDKGPMLATLYAIKYLHETKQLPVNVEFIYETYEENGSLGFDSLFGDALRKGLLVKPDSILVSDGVFLGEYPTIDVALRGLLKVKVSVQTASKNIHSGLGGGVVRNPFHILMAALSKCYDLQGTKIPYHAEADVSMRLVGKQNPRSIFASLRTYLQQIYPSIKVDLASSTPAVNISPHNAFVQKAALACQYGYGEAPLYINSGGTIGAFVAIQQQFPTVPIVSLNMSKASDGYHAPNEKFEWEQARRGMKTMAAYVKGIGGLRTTHKS